MVVFYMHVSSSDGGGSLCPRQLVWRWWGPMSACLVMVHALQTSFPHFNVTVRLHVFFGRPHPRLAPAVQRRTVLRRDSRDMRPTYWPVFRNLCALTGENPRHSVGGEETTTCCSYWWRTLADAEGFGQRNSSDVFCTLSVRRSSSSSSRLPCSISTDPSVSESYIPQNVRNKTKQKK